MFRSKLLGGILFIVGTSIGGGMLVMPVSIASVGMLHSIIFLLACWLIMTAGALLIMETNLRLPIGSNLVSMAKLTLGLPGQIIAWIAYLLLLYTLLSAYIAGGGDVLNNLLMRMHIPSTSRYTAIMFTLIFSIIIYCGMKTVDYINRVLMLGKLGVYVILIGIISPHIQLSQLSGGASSAILGSLMLLVTSFGFASVVPTLCEYLNQDAKLLRKTIIIGSLIPLVCYTVWITVIMGVIARSGPHGLLALNHAEYTISALTIALNTYVHNAWISVFFASFTSICMVTAFLGVSIGLFDFLADGLSLKKTGIAGKVLLILTFIPPLILVLFKPGLYLHAFNYAGICCVILLLLLPTLMSWRARKLQPDDLQIVPGGNYVLLGLGIIALCLLWVAWVYR